MKNDKSELVEENTAARSPFVLLDMNVWSSIIGKVPVQRYRKNQMIYDQYDEEKCVYLVKSGRVRLDIYSLEGDKRSIFIADKGSLFGELHGIDGFPHECCATASTDTQIYIIPMQLFFDELRTNNAFCLSVLKLMAQKTRLLVTQVRQVTFNDSYYRVCSVLLFLARQYGKTENGVCEISMKFTHQELGHLLGLSRVSVTNCFLRMENEGIIEKVNGNYVIRDMSQLIEHVQGNC